MIDTEFGPAREYKGERLKGLQPTLTYVGSNSVSLHGESWIVSEALYITVARFVLLEYDTTDAWMFVVP